VKKLDKETNIACMSVALSGEQTQKAFSKSCDLFNEVGAVKSSNSDTTRLDKDIYSFAF
jgi:hypothetical protein